MTLKKDGTVKGIVSVGLVISTLALGGCAGATASDPFQAAPGVRAEASSISVYARNLNEEDVTLYVMSPSGIQKVGTVAPNRSETFSVDWDSTWEARVRVEILAGPRYTTNSLPVIAPGDRLEVQVGENARRSVLRRR